VSETAAIEDRKDSFLLTMENACSGKNFNGRKRSTPTGDRCGRGKIADKKSNTGREKSSNVRSRYVFKMHEQKNISH
jgi:hypothetical protein